MIALIQRVTQASVSVNKQVIGKINNGLLVLLGVEKHDDTAAAKKLAAKVINYRVFNDEQGKMNLNLNQVNGQLLVVSQFTLAADTSRGLRPSFSKSTPPEQAKELYQAFLDNCQDLGIAPQTGEFGADMQVQLLNDGPVTFTLTS